MPVRVGVIDSGVHASHPHVKGVTGGVGITRQEPGEMCREEADYVDRLGHGTAVTAVIREKAPAAAVFAVKIFYGGLSTRIETLVYAIDWCVRNRMDLINLSLGTENPAHERVLRAAVDRVVAAGIVLFAAYEDGGVRWFPGCLPGVAPVVLDWECPRDEYRTAQLEDGRMLYRASGYPRPIAGVPVARNLKGISFAVANVTGCVASEMEGSRAAKEEAV